MSWAWRAALVAVVALASCGGQNMPEDRIADTLSALRERFDDGDLRSVCSGMTRPARRRATGFATADECATGLRRLLPADGRSSSGRRSGERDVLGVRERRDRAWATVTLNERVPGELRFVRTEGGWLLDGLEVRPLPRRSSWKAMASAGERYSIHDVRRGERTHCPSLTKSTPADVDGGCELRLESPGAPFVLYTAVGDFEVARCRGALTLHVDDYAVLGHGVEFDGPGCERIEHCRHGETGLTYPWQGQKVPAGRGVVALRLDICVRTPAGYVRGFQVLELRLRADDWTARPADYPVGDRSVEIGGRWDVEPDSIRFAPPVSPFD